MAGILRPQSGEIEIKGRPLRSYPPKALARAVAFVPQRLPVDIPFTVGEAVMLGRAPYQGALGVERKIDLEIVNRPCSCAFFPKIGANIRLQVTGG